MGLRLLGMTTSEMRSTNLVSWKLRLSSFTSHPRPSLSQITSDTVSSVRRMLSKTRGRLPGCARSRKDPKNLYFVGVADSAKLGDAKTTSKDNAIRNAASFLARTLSAEAGELDIDKLALSLAQASEDAGNYISFDQKNGIYRYYTLIRLNKFVAEARFNLFAVQNGITAPACLIQTLGDTQRPRIQVQRKLPTPEIRRSRRCVTGWRSTGVPGRVRMSIS